MCLPDQPIRILPSPLCILPSPLCILSSPLRQFASYHHHFASYHRHFATSHPTIATLHPTIATSPLRILPSPLRILSSPLRHFASYHHHFASYHRHFATSHPTITTLHPIIATSPLLNPPLSLCDFVLDILALFDDESSRSSYIIAKYCARACVSMCSLMHVLCVHVFVLCTCVRIRVRACVHSSEQITRKAEQGDFNRGATIERFTSYQVMCVPRNNYRLKDLYNIQIF